MDLFGGSQLHADTTFLRQLADFIDEHGLHEMTGYICAHPPIHQITVDSLYSFVAWAQALGVEYAQSIAACKLDDQLVAVAIGELAGQRLDFSAVLSREESQTLLENGLPVRLSAVCDLFGMEWKPRKRRSADRSRVVDVPLPAFEDAG